MIPVFVGLAGLSVIGFCLYVLKRTGFAAWRRTMKDEAAKDAKRFSSDETIG